MRNKTSILTLSLLCFATLFGDNDANAQRARNRRRVSATKSEAKISEASDYANSSGATSDVASRAATAEDCSAGTFFKDATCQACPSNTWSTGKATSCTSCGEHVLSCNSTTGDVISCEGGYTLEGKTCVKDKDSTIVSPNPDDTSVIKDLRQKFSLQLTEVTAACSGVASDLKDIEALNGVSTVAGGVAGAAGVAAIVEAHAIKDKTTVTKGEGEEETTEEKDNTSAKKVARIATNAGATLASGTATVTSSVATAKVKSLGEKAKNCNNNLNDLKIIKNTLIAEITDLDKDANADKTVVYATKVLDACSGKFDEAKIQKVFGKSLASAITSGVGTVASGVATGLVIAGTGDDVVIGPEKEVKDKEGNVTGKKRKGVSANDILSGITAGTGTATAVLGGINWAQLASMRKDAETCQAVLSEDRIILDTETRTILNDVRYNIAEPATVAPMEETGDSLSTEKIEKVTEAAEEQE